MPSTCISIGSGTASTNSNTTCTAPPHTKTLQTTSPNITHPPTTAECANTSSTQLLAQSSFRLHLHDVLRGCVNPNRDSPNGYPSVKRAKLQPVTLAHKVDAHKTLTAHKLACSYFVALFWSAVRTSSIPLIGIQPDFLATGQTGDDVFSSIPITQDVDDPEQLTGESIQSYLTLVIQLQWLVVLGRLVTHAQVTTLPKLMVAYIDLKTTIYGYIHIFQDNTSFKLPSSTHTHAHTHKLYISLHIIMHVSTRTCCIHHKRGVTEV